MEDREVDTVVSSVSADLGDGVDREEVRRAAEPYLLEFDSARIRDFVPILAERRLRNDLRVLASR